MLCASYCSGSVKLRESSELSVQSNESLTSISSKLINATATPPPTTADLELSSDMAADYRELDGLLGGGTASSSSFLRADRETNRPRYMGICLPRNILALFQNRTPSRSYVTIDPSSLTKTLTTATLSTDIAGSIGPATSSSSASSITNMPPPVVCLMCSRNGGLGAAAASTNKFDDDVSKHHKKLILLKHFTDSKRVTRNEVPEEDRVLVAILNNVQRMANPVLMKQSKLNLLELKQKHADQFQDLCLYSEILKSVGQSTYRQNSRRFLQELFLDVDFERMLYESLDALNIRERQPPMPAEPTDAELRNGGGGGAGGRCETIDEVDCPVATGVVSNSNIAPDKRGASIDGNGADDDCDDGGGDYAVARASTLSRLSGGGGGDLTRSNSKTFSRVPLACTVNKFPVKRDRANSLNVQHSTRTTPLSAESRVE